MILTSVTFTLQIRFIKSLIKKSIKGLSKKNVSNYGQNFIYFYLGLV